MSNWLWIIVMVAVAAVVLLVVWKVSDAWYDRRAWKIRQVRVQPSRYFNVEADTRCGLCGETIKKGNPAMFSLRGELRGYRCDCDIKP